MTSLPEPQYGPLVPDWVKPYVDFVQALSRMTVTVTNEPGAPGTAAIDFNGATATLRLNLPSGVSTQVQYSKPSGGSGQMNIVKGLVTQTS